MTRMLIVAAVLLTPALAHADAEDQIGLGARAGALQAVGAVDTGFAAVHHGPAALPHGASPGDVELGLGFLFAQPLLFVERPDGEALEPAADTPGTAALLVGTRFDLGSVFGLEGLFAGLSFYTPVTHIFRYSIHPDDSVQWLMYTDRTQHLDVHAGLGFRPIDWLSVGLSVRVLFDLETFTDGNVTEVVETRDPDTGETRFAARTRLGEEVRVFGHASPIASVLVTPLPDLAFGFAFRAETFVDDWGWTRTSATAGIGALGYIHRFTHYYRPHELAWSASWRPIDRLEVSADLTWALWSNALTVNHEPLGDSGRFGDTLTPALGARFAAIPGVDALAGYSFVRSPFDNFGGPTNLLDNDRHVGSIGMDVDLGALTDGDVPFSARWSFRVAGLVTRDEEKDFRRFPDDVQLERNPGFPSYSHGGALLSGQLELEARW